MKRRLTISAIGSLALVAALVFAVGSAYAGTTKETLTAPFDLGPTATTTQKAYSGDLVITVSGTGQAAGTRLSDAFYIFTDEAGNAITPEPAGVFGLFINGRPATEFIGSLPPYSGNHVYQFILSLSSKPVKLTFGVGDTFTSDNTGAYTIVVARGAD